MQAIFEFDTDRYPAGQLVVASFRGIEEISKPYRFEIVLTAADVDHGSLGRDLLGQRARFILRGAAEVDRVIQGIVRDVVAEGISSSTFGKHRYRVRLVPRLWLLSQSKNSRIFQDESVVEIVDRLLAESNVSRRWHVVEPRPKRGYCVQRDESDLAFIERLLAEEGIYYAFDGSGGAGDDDVVVFSDDARLASPIDGAPQLAFRESVGMTEKDHDVSRFFVKEHLRPNATLLRKFDYMRPSLELHATATVGADGAVEAAPAAAAARIEPAEGQPERTDASLYRVYEHEGELEGTRVSPALARRHLEQYRAEARAARGDSRCRRLAPGRWIELGGAAIPEHDGRYLVIRVEHRGRHPEAGTLHAGELDIYQNRFSCVPADVPYRPARPARKLQQVTETATVVGPPGHEIHTDALGRIKVQFHWDRQGRRNQHSSCWVRVAQAWAGTGWGFQFIPRIGMEVLVTFLEGDVDRPLVIGCVPNEEHPPPFPLPDEKSKSGIVTQSTRGGGGNNELSFEDRKGFERVYLRAERDLQENVLHDQVTQIGRNRGLDVKGNLSVSAGLGMATLVGQNQLTSIGGDSIKTVGGVDRGVIEGALVRDVRGDGDLKLEGDLRETVGGDHLSVVDGHASTRVSASRDERIGRESRVQVDGDRSTFIGGSDRSAIAGALLVSARKGASLAVGSDTDVLRADLSATGDASIQTPGTIVISAARELRLQVGKSSLVLTPEEAVLEAKTVALSAERVELVTDDTSVLLSDSFEARSKSLRLTSESEAKLELSVAARLAGPKVELGGAAGADKLTRERREREEASAPKTVIHLFDRAGRRLTDAPYEVSMPGFSKRGTSADGTVEVPVFDDVQSCMLRWGRPAEGAPGEFAFQSEIFLRVGVADQNEALRRRLLNLGHYCHSLEEMVRAYETTAGRAPRGEVDVVKGEAQSDHQSVTPRGRV